MIRSEGSLKYFKKNGIYCLLDLDALGARDLLIEEIFILKSGGTAIYSPRCLLMQIFSVTSASGVFV